MSKLKIDTRITLNNGKTMPMFGLGVFKALDVTYDAVQWAVDAGYRLIDTAMFYNNEEEVGKAVRECGVNREEIFVTTKLWNSDQREHRQREAFFESLERLGLDYIDLYLIHWPVQETILESWRILEELYAEGYVKSIGVSNFLENHLEALLPEVKVRPSVNQVEIHPYNTRESLRKYCAEQGIAVQAWGPMARGSLKNEAILHTIGKTYNKTWAQTVLRWHLQNNTLIIPKSSNQERIIENANIFDFSLTPEEMKQIDGLNKDKATIDPNNFDF